MLKSVKPFGNLGKKERATKNRDLKSASAFSWGHVETKEMMSQMQKFGVGQPTQDRVTLGTPLGNRALLGLWKFADLLGARKALRGRRTH